MIVGIWKSIEKAIAKRAEYTELFDSNNIRLVSSDGIQLNAKVKNRMPQLEQGYAKTDLGWAKITKQYALVGRSLFFHCGDLFGGEI